MNDDDLAVLSASSHTCRATQDMVNILRSATKAERDMHIHNAQFGLKEAQRLLEMIS